MVPPVPREIAAAEAEGDWSDLASTLSEDYINSLSVWPPLPKASQFSSAHEGAEGAAAKKRLPKGALLHLAGKPDEFVALSDVILVVENYEVPAHSQLLAASSSVFCNMFLSLDTSGAGSSSNAGTPTRLERCFHVKKLHQVVQFLCNVYGQPLELKSVKEAESLVQIADEYDCQELMRLSLSFLRQRAGSLMKNNCDEENGVLKWALWAQRYHLPEFLAEAEHRIMSNFAAVQDDKRLAELHPESLLRIICGIHRCSAASAQSLAKATKKTDLLAWASNGRGWPQSTTVRERRYIE